MRTRAAYYQPVRWRKQEDGNGTYISGTANQPLAGRRDRGGELCAGRALNSHVSADLVVTVQEEGTALAIHETADGRMLFAGRITGICMIQEKGLCLLALTALSYTMEWDLALESRSFTNLSAAYREVMDKVLAPIHNTLPWGAVPWSRMRSATRH